MTSLWPRRNDGQSPRRHAPPLQPDCLDSVDSSSTVSSYSSSSHFQQSFSSSSAASRRFRFHSKTLSQPQAQNLSQSARSDASPTEQEGTCDERPQFTSRGTYNPEKGKQKLKGARHSMAKHMREGEGPAGDPPDIPPHLVLYGNNEFMV